MTASAMVAEFDDVAGWTADAVERLGERYAIPAACRGSANPAALAWLGEACELRAGSVLLDVGAGVGGPAAWAAERFGVRPILLEPMPAACRAAARLFGLPVVTADGDRIPLRAGSVDAAWCLGVLDTVQDKAAVLREIHRVLPPGAPLGLLVVVARDPRALAPEGNSFPTRRGLADLLDGAGFDLVEQVGCPGDAPLSWTRRVERVVAAVAGRHRADPAHALALRQGETFTRLFAAGQISMQLIHATRRRAGRSSEQFLCGGHMSTSTGDEFEVEFEAEVEAELTLAESGDQERASEIPASEWLFDPIDVEREEVELRNLLGAAGELEAGSRPRKPCADEGA
ncbi:class I SAM-dependent methyltransferase [Actinomadura barringtoniae]|uniref:Class I SAM-dependent methyltransferase n=1 Tax=Actinomadura barringtoniae TaxID=1427535 RepID=A0A939T4S9_9ACTN|nr:class I SAM-dependent methyltransferase [Actinomadura barringtoniae]MBO2448644.1 class I SAM-dependent methyltransferase [Actinomadura barringtoniae]